MLSFSLCIIFFLCYFSPSLLASQFPPKISLRVVFSVSVSHFPHVMVSPTAASIFDLNSIVILPFAPSKAPFAITAEIESSVEVSMFVHGGVWGAWVSLCSTLYCLSGLPMRVKMAYSLPLMVCYLTIEK